MPGTSSASRTASVGGGNPSHPAASGILLAFKADMVLGFQLVSRHRAPRAAVLLAAALVAAALLGADPPGITARQRTLLVVACAMATVAASRLFAHGGALTAARRAAGLPWLVAAGRLAGSLLFVGPLACIAAAALFAGGAVQNAVQAGAAALLCGGALAALVMAAAPLAGASAAGSLGLLASLFGLARPSEVQLLLDSLPLLRSPVLWAWNLLPLPWRAARWASEGGWQDPACLLLWLVLGTGLAGWVASLPADITDRGRPS